MRGLRRARLPSLIANQEPACPMIGESEVVVHEADDPDTIGDLLDSGGLTSNGQALVDLPLRVPQPGDAAPPLKTRRRRADIAAAGSASPYPALLDLAANFAAREGDACVFARQRDLGRRGGKATPARGGPEHGHSFPRGGRADLRMPIPPRSLPRGWKRLGQAHVLVIAPTPPVLPAKAAASRAR